MGKKKEDTKYQRYFKERGINASYVAEKMNISRQAVAYKLNGSIKWSLQDALKLKGITRMTKTEFNKLFRDCDWYDATKDQYGYES